MIVNPYVFASGGVQYPQVRAIAKSSFSTGSSSNWALPSYSAGDMLIAMVAHRSTSVTLTLPSGWTLLANLAQSTNIRGSIYWKIADGSEGSTIPVTSSSSAVLAIIIASIKGGTFSPTIPPAVSQIGLLTDAPDPPSLTPEDGSGKYLVIAEFSARSDMPVSTYPYAGGDYIISSGTTGISGTATTQAVCFGTFDAASIDPGAFTSTVTNRGLVASTIAIKAAA
ncbi:hypothetical protein D9M68_176720 [compost metagenome]